MVIALIISYFLNRVLIRQIHPHYRVKIVRPYREPVVLGNIIRGLNLEEDVQRTISVLGQVCPVIDAISVDLIRNQVIITTKRGY